jgi:hypothetical protein
MLDGRQDLELCAVLVQRAKRRPTDGHDDACHGRPLDYEQVVGISNEVNTPARACSGPDTIEMTPQDVLVSDDTSGSTIY